MAKKGYQVIRTKLEATASIKGVPDTDAEAQILPSSTYFEFHMVFENQDGSSPTEEQLGFAKELAQSFQKEYHFSSFSLY